MRIALVTNMLTPYRAHFYSKLGQTLINKDVNFRVFVSVDNELGRNWYYNDLTAFFIEVDF